MRGLGSTTVCSAVILFVSLATALPGARGDQLPAAGPGSPEVPSAASLNPRHPETQPSLTVDRDPIVAPQSVKAESASETSSHSSSQASKSGQELRKGENGVYTLSENVNEVLLNCAVIDKKGRLVTDLKRDDFRIWEDGVPQRIDVFLRQDLPASIGILVDNSGSMRDKRSAVEMAALDLMRASNPKDAAFIVNFSDRAYLDQGFTSNISLLKRGLSRFDAKGTTAIYDAVAASADELARYSKQPRQVLVIITDGSDNASRLSLQQVIRRVQRLGGPVVYSIGLLYGVDEGESRQAKAALEALSSDTGGIAYFPASLQQVDEIALEIARDIREQYTIGYHPKRPDSLGGYRTVRVEASARGYKKLIVRTRKGYYARPEGNQKDIKTAAVTSDPGSVQSKP